MNPRIGLPLLLGIVLAACGGSDDATPGDGDAAGGTETAGGAAAGGGTVTGGGTAAMGGTVTAGGTKAGGGTDTAGGTEAAGGTETVGGVGSGGAAGSSQAAGSGGSAGSDAIAGNGGGGAGGNPNPPGGRTHLLLFSGQSNMSRMLWSDYEKLTGLQLDKVFMPAVRAAFPKDQFVIVPVAYGGRPIADWVPRAKIYNELVAEAKQKMAGKTPSTITFLWRQGEADHDNDALAQAYKNNLKKLYAQLTEDFKTNDINWVIGRLNDAANRMAPDYEHHDNWMLIRQDEVDTANGMKRGRWVDCDKFNDGAGNGVHGSPADYLAQQQAFADSTIELLKAFP